MKDSHYVPDAPLLTFAFKQSDSCWIVYSLVHACVLLLQQCRLTSAKILGGSSSIDCMLYIRGSRHDFDKWETIGCSGWSYENVLPYFMKSENNVNNKFVQSGLLNIDLLNVI